MNETLTWKLDDLTNKKGQILYSQLLAFLQSRLYAKERADEVVLDLTPKKMEVLLDIPGIDEEDPVLLTIFFSTTFIHLLNTAKSSTEINNEPTDFNLNDLAKSILHGLFSLLQGLKDNGNLPETNLHHGTDIVI